MSEIHLSSEPQASASDIQQVENAVHEFNMRLMNDWDYRPIRIFLRDDEGRIQGGIIGGIWGGWFHIMFLWVDETLRKHGYGSQLLKAAEAEARSHGCAHAFLETHDFQAPDFYKQHGYEVFAELPDYPPAHAMYFMKKTW
jgi:GNAT superfamily N-acetyltransferase